MSILPPTAENIARAAAAIRAGEVVAYPTETVYGLAVDPFSQSAMERLYAVKGRENSQAVLLIVADEAQAAALVSELSAAARGLMEAFWPGPLSLLLPPAEGLPDELLRVSGKVCVRCPGNEFARALCAAFGGAVTSTSANLSGQPPAKNAQDALLPGVALVLDGGPAENPVPSTVFDPHANKMWREGAITRSMLDAVLAK